MGEGGDRKHGATYCNHCVVITGTLLKLVAVVTIVTTGTRKVRITSVSKPCINIYILLKGLQVKFLSDFNQNCNASRNVWLKFSV